MITKQLLVAFLIAAGAVGTGGWPVNHAQDVRRLRRLRPLSSFPGWSINSGPSIGENIFRAKCSVCHGVDGAGRTENGKKLKVPDLRSERIKHHDDDELLDVITNGKGDMPPFGKKYSTDKLQQVVAYVRSLNQKN